MLPYFHADGCLPYAKSANLYPQNMIRLEETVDGQTFRNFKNGFFTPKQTEEFNSGTWTDMIIKQDLIPGGRVTLKAR